MFFHPSRLVTHTLLLSTVLALGSLSGTAFAAELEATGSPGLGVLKPATRAFAPEIEPASAEGKEALSHMKLPAGLTAKLWAAEPMLANPVAFNLDEQGRVFVSETHRYRTSTLDIRDYLWMLEDDLDNRTQEDFLASIKRNFGDAGVKQLSQESERLMLLEDTNGDGVADKSSVYAENFRTPLDGIASGVMIHRGDVWFTNIPTLWKFTGKNKAETRTEMFRGFGLRYSYTGHDFHGLVLGPDGRIYFSIGDRGASVPTKEGGRVEIPDNGGVFRCWPDGTGLELFATGLRNPQSLLFNEYGDLFTGDNDSDLGDQERLVHIVQDGDSGWRIGWQHAPRGRAGQWNNEKYWWPRFEGQASYILPPICNIEDGPSGVAYYPGTGLSPEYAGHIFICHFKGSITNSGIYSYKVKPDGATYAIDTAAPFLTGALPTDVRFGPDGKLYYSDWAEGWPKSKKGRIYTIFNPKLVNDPLTQSTQQLIASDYAKKSDDELAKLLAHPDWRVRLEAQYTLADRGESSIPALADIAGKATDFSRLHSVWALGQIAAKNPKAITALRALSTRADAEVRAQAIKTLGDLRDSGAADTYVAGLRDASARVRFFSAQALGRIKHSAATADLFAAASANNDSDLVIRHALVMALSRCATIEQLAATATDKSRAIRMAGLLTLRRLESPQLTAFLGDQDPWIVREAVIAINDVPVAAGYPAIAAFVTKPVNDEPIMLRALNASFRLGTAEQAATLAAYAANGNAPAVLRKEALDLLAQWPEPFVRDRIVGVYRPLPEKTRSAGVATDALAPVLSDIFAVHTPDSVQTSAIEALAALKLTDAIPTLRSVVADNAQSASVRVAALKALDQFDDTELAGSAALAAASDLPDLRLAALSINSRLAPATAVANLTKLIEHGSAKEQQTAFRALGSAKDTAADAILLAQLNQLAIDKVAPGAQLDLLEAAARRSDPQIKKFLTDRDAALAKNPDPLAPFRVALEGGNAGAGQQLFIRHPVMQCIRCHRVGEFPGGEAGPNLAGIGARESREYILESLIKPSAKIAKGFEIVTVIKKNGEALSGTLVRRDDKMLELKTGETETIDIPASGIKKVESAPSAMPEIAALVLTKTEIRDLVEYVASFTTPFNTHGQSSIRALQGYPGGVSGPSGH